MPDVFQDVDALPEDRVAAIAERLEFRARAKQFVRMRTEYFDALELRDDAKLLELGGGTGVVGRAYASRKGFRGTCVVSDLSQALLDFGQARAAEENLTDRVKFQVADAMNSEALQARQFDAVILHTVVSHVPNPEATLETAARCAVAGGQVAVFDADCESMQVASGNALLDSKANAALKSTIIANTTIMRALPRLARNVGLRLKCAQSHLLAEVGRSEFFLGLARSYTGIVVAQGGLSESEGDAWVSAVEEAVEREEFFGMCPYFSYLFEN